MRNWIITLFSLFVVQQLYAQQSASTQVNFQITGLKSSSVLIGRYYGGDLYRVDSVTVDTTTGRFRLLKPDLRPGLYFVDVADNRLFNFLIIGARDSFSVRGNMNRPDSLTAEHSSENQAFFEFETKRKAIENKMAEKRSIYQTVQRATKNDPEALKPFRDEIQGLIRKIDVLGSTFQKQHPTHMYARMLHSIEVPDVPQKIKAEKSNKAALRWNRTHYFDYTNWRDSVLLCNDLWATFFDNYFNRLTAPHPDSITTSIDYVLKKMPRDGAFYRFAVIRLSRNFEQSKFVGADRVFVHMISHYLKKESTPWLDEATLLRLEYKADVHRPNLTGNLVPPLELPDEKGALISIQKVEAPMLLLVFYSPLCTHCQAAMPGIYQTWLDYRKTGLKAIAVNADTEYQHWKQFVQQQNWEWINISDPSGKKNETMEKNFAPFNLPIIYILDKNKRILRKWVTPEELGNVLGGLMEGG